MKKRDEDMPAEDDFEAFEGWEEEEEGEEEELGEPEESEEVGEEFEEEPEEEPEEPKAKPAEEKPRGPVPRRPATAKAAKPQPKIPQKFDAAALDLAPDVPVQVIAVMGKRGVTIKELMEMRMGQVIDLKRPPNETVDIVVNGKLFARGELVEIDGKLGVKILKLVR